MSLPVDWRCTGCRRLLGRRLGEQLHIRLSKAAGDSYDYIVSLPARATCRACGTANQMNPEAREALRERESAGDGASCPSTTLRT